jgi:hypothetical protein
MDAYEILVLILGATLAVFLVLGIVTLIYLLKILQHVRVITQKAENVASIAETASRTVFASATPVFVVRTLMKFIKKSTRK